MKSKNLTLSSHISAYLSIHCLHIHLFMYLQFSQSHCTSTNTFISLFGHIYVSSPFPFLLSCYPYVCSILNLITSLLLYRFPSLISPHPPYTSPFFPFTEQVTRCLRCAGCQRAREWCTQDFCLCLTDPRDSAMPGFGLCVARC